MRDLGFGKKKLITLAATAALLASSLGAYKVNAASSVELDKAVTIAAVIADGYSSQFANGYEGLIYIDLYKIATVDAAGNVDSLTSDFANSGADVSVLNDSPDVETVKNSIVNKVLSVAETVTPTATIEAEKTADGLEDAYVDIPNGAGIYLFVPRDCQDDGYDYTFTPYILYAPTSEYITTGTGSDKWNYEINIALKAEDTPRFGDIEIVKRLNTYNQSLGTASFVFEVEATRDGKSVFDDVYTLTFDENSENVDGAFQDSIYIEKIPAQTTVTVTEVYSGASYTIDSTDSLTQTIESLPASVETEDGLKNYETVTFTNDYDGHLIEGGISVVNTFEKIESETETQQSTVTYEYSGNNLEGGNEE